jgi:hypothetical protein
MLKQHNPRRVAIRTTEINEFSFWTPYSTPYPIEGEAHAIALKALAGKPRITSL